MQARAKKLATAISRKKKVLLIVMGWTALVAFIVIEIFWLKYLEIPRLTLHKIIFTRYEAPAPQLVDVLILFVASLVVPFFMSTVSDLVYGFIASLFLSFSISVAYVFLYIWYIQDWGVLFSTGPFDWEIPLYFAILNVFRIMFPTVLATCLVGAVIGSVVKGWMPRK